jgi:hypothetical protein
MSPLPRLCLRAKGQTLAPIHCKISGFFAVQKIEFHIRCLPRARSTKLMHEPPCHISLGFELLRAGELEDNGFNQIFRFRKGSFMDLNVHGCRLLFQSARLAC